MCTHPGAHDSHRGPGRARPNRTLLWRDLADRQSQASHRSQRPVAGLTAFPTAPGHLRGRLAKMPRIGGGKRQTTQSAGTHARLGGARGRVTAERGEDSTTQGTELHATPDRRPVLDLGAGRSCRRTAEKRGEREHDRTSASGVAATLNYWLRRWRRGHENSAWALGNSR